MPEARQNSSKLAEMLAIASSFNALGGTAVNEVVLFMALLSFVESAPRAYRLKASNAAPPISTSIGTIPTAGIAHEIKNPLNFVNNFSGVSAELIDELQETLGKVKVDAN